MEISLEAIDLIIAWEVGGGDRDAARPLYERKYTYPHWPGKSASGLTIGIGYDLRYQVDHFEGDWKERLAAHPVEDAYDRLSEYLGKRGSKDAATETEDIAIPWDDAIAVYRTRRLPAYIQETKRAFSGVDALGPDVWGALTSLIYNCGAGTKGKPLKAAAYKTIREGIAEQSRQGIADGILEMKAFHEENTPNMARGLGRRRDDEAALVLKSETTAAGAIAQPNPSVA